MKNLFNNLLSLRLELWSGVVVLSSFTAATDIPLFYVWDSFRYTISNIQCDFSFAIALFSIAKHKSVIYIHHHLVHRKRVLCFYSKAESEKNYFPKF